MKTWVRWFYDQAFKAGVQAAVTLLAFIMNFTLLTYSGASNTIGFLSIGGYWRSDCSNNVCSVIDLVCLCLQMIWTPAA